jgi:GR25 family glycosyltransferase involved in LPS biosynthesis
MFSGGLANTTIAIIELLKLLEHDVYLLNTNNSVSWYDDCKLLKQNIEVINISRDDSTFENKFDIVIELVPYFLNINQRRVFSKKNIFLYRKGILIPTLENSLYPIIQQKINYDGIEEVWCFKELTNSDEVQILEVITRKPVIELPYIWSPSIIEAHKNEHNLPLWLQIQGSIASQNEGRLPLWSPHICETNNTSSSSCTIPLVTLRQAKLSGFLFNKYTVHNSDQLLQSQFFKDNVQKHCSVEDLSGSFVGRQRMIDFIFEPMSCVISHVRFIPFKPMLLDLAWFGIPFIHNSEFLNNISCFERYYYPNNKISVAVEKLQLLHKDFTENKGWFQLENIEKSRKNILENYSCLNKNTLEKYKSRLENINKIPEEIIVETPSYDYILMFTDMWSEFNCSYNFFTLLLTEANKDLKILFCGENSLPVGKSPNAIFFGPFGDSWKKYPLIPKIHYTGENTPPIQEESVKLNLGFAHADMVGDSYLRFPLWILEIDWFNCNMEKIVNPKPIPLDRCTNVKYDELTRKKKFCAFIVSNPTNSIRNMAFQWINSYKSVDSAGRLFNNLGTDLFAGGGGGGGELKKLEFLKDYKFCIAYENNSSQGYVTEKYLHAKAAGCIPIYWGDPKIERDFDINGCIDARNIHTKEELIAAVQEIDTNDALYIKKYSVPALDDYKVSWARRTMAECASRILNIITKNKVDVPRFISTNNVDASEAPRNNSIETPLIVTYVTREFLPSLNQWLASFDAQRSTLPNLEALVYLGNDVSELSKTKLLETFSFVKFKTLPENIDAMKNFPDIWDSKHYAWKIYIYQDIVNNTLLKDKMIFYLDAGGFMCRWPSDYLRLAQKNDICVLEDDEQFNYQWCSEPCKRIMKISSSELEEKQIVGGIMSFRAGSKIVKDFFNEAWSYAQQRNCIVGEKWSGMKDGKPFGHRHDQSIMSVLRLRHKLTSYPLQKLYCDISLRRTFLTNKNIYVHRGNFVIHTQFLKGIDDCFVINLKRRKDRLEKLYNNSPYLKNRIIEFEAFEGKNIKLTKSIARLFRPHDFMWKKAVMGCALSHLQMWHQLANEKPDINNYLILEDDVKLQDGWEQKWNEALSSLPENYDVIYLGGVLPPNRQGFETIKEPINKYFSRVKENNFFGQDVPNRYFHFCAYSYILSKEGARKIMAIIEAKDGYWTSADHMICNPIDFLNIYFLDPLVAGCIQDDDPIYKSSEFNNFNRVDKFDSDLWNNDERFSKELIEQVGTDDKINITKALYEARTFMNNEIITNVENPPTKNIFNRICILESQNVEWDKLYEHSWLHELFGKPNIIELQKVTYDKAPSVERPIFLVQKGHFENYKKLFSYYESKDIKYYILHLSDEHGNDDISFYDNNCCLGIIRNYVRSGLNNKVTVIPLGYHYTVGNGVENPLERTPQTPFRSNVWSFFGTGWNNREAILDMLKPTGKNTCKLFNTWNDGQNLGKQEYISILLDTLFVPCIGGQNPETFRLYEALECGCIPILVVDEHSQKYFQYINQYLPFLNLTSWNQAPSLIQQLLNDKESLESYRFLLLNNYRIMKENIKSSLQKMLV